MLAIHWDQQHQFRSLKVPCAQDLEMISRLIDVNEKDRLLNHPMHRRGKIMVLCAHDYNFFHLHERSVEAKYELERAL